jgi:lactoylglutathione lyase
LSPVPSHLVFYVQDVQSAAEFYQKAFNFPAPTFLMQAQYVEFYLETIILGFVSRQWMADFLGEASLGFPQAGLTPCMQISLRVDHLDDAYHQAVAHGARVISPPQKQPWGVRAAFLKDPHGIVIELCPKT